MARLMGINVLADGNPSVNEDEMKQYLARLRPCAAVIMDSIKMYEQTLASGSVTLPIFRRYDRNDAKWHEVMTPQEWIEQHKEYFLDGAIIQVYNEPGGYQDLKPLAQWSAQLLDLAPANVRFVLPNFAVGNPDIKRINDGELDELFKALAKHKRHFLGAHEYFLSDPLKETPDSDRSDDPLIGRYRVYYRRFEALGLERPQIIVTEHGRDKGGGRGPNGDGWSGQMDEAQYIQHLQNAMQTVYSPDNVPVCIFCYGRGFSDDWMTFDIRSATKILDSIVTLNETLGDSFGSFGVLSPPAAPPPPPPAPPKRPVWQPQPINPAGRKAYVGKVSAVDGHWTQVYAEPTTTAQDVGDLMFGQRLIYYPDDARQGFVNVEYDGISGWVQIEPAHVQFEGEVFIMPTSPPPVTGGTPHDPGEGMSRQALLDLAAHYDELAQQADAVVAQFSALATKYHGLADEYKAAAAHATDAVQPSPPTVLPPPVTISPPPLSPVTPPVPPPPPPPPAEGGYINVIIDLSHHNRVTSFADVKADGILGIIHKATQATTHVDSWYSRRRDNAKPHGFLWGAYHFGVGGDVSGQVNHFLQVVQPDAQTLLVLDWERNPIEGQTTMNRAEAEDFVRQIHDRTGRYPVLYSRANFIHQHVGNDTTILSQCPLWIAHWSDEPALPPQWSKIHIWQYTGDGKGPEPHTVNGVTGAIDRDKFNGTVEDLRKFWGVTS